MKCLNEIAYCNYSYMGPYIEQIGGITTAFINDKPSNVATQAIEFWKTLCEVEIEKNNKGQAHMNIIATYKDAILTITKLGLSKMEPGDTGNELGDTEEDEWNTSMAAGNCIEHMA